MIPLKLQIKNFLSYGSELQTIDFEPYNLICLSGKNGHGKSALLDAITWAIWGEARKNAGISKPDHGLLRLGQRHMIIIFDFEFNKSKYRVRREFTFAYEKPYAYLEFGIFETGTDKLIPLTDKTIKASQQKIDSMLGLNYEAFVNSAFLRQGSSNEFSKKSSKERKEILAGILGLDKYETLRKSALEKVKQFLSEKETLSKLQEHMEKELLSYDEIKANLSSVQTDIQTLSLRETEFSGEILSLNNTKTDISAKLQQYQMVNFQSKKLHEDKDIKIRDLGKCYRDWKEAHKKKIHILKNFNKFDKNDLELNKQRLTAQLEDHQSKFHQKLETKETYLKYREQEQLKLKELQDKQNLIIQEKKLNLERSLINQQNIAGNLKQNEKIKKDLLNEIKKIELELKDIANKFDKQSSEKIEKQFEKRKNFYQTLIARGNQLKSEAVDLERKKKLSFDEQNPSCPLCEQNLSASRKRFLTQQFAAQEAFLNHRLKRITGLIQKLKELLLKQHDQIKLNKDFFAKELELKNIHVKILQQIQTSDIQHEELLNNELIFVKQIDSCNKELSDLSISSELLISDNIEYQKIKTILIETESKLNSILYEPELHKATIVDLKNIELLLADYANMHELLFLQDQRKLEISNLCKSIKVLKKEIKALAEKLGTFGDLESQEKEIKNKENILLNNLKELSKQKETLVHSSGSLENQKSKLEKLAVEHKNQKKFISTLDETIDEYKTISIALGKDGIQALLIEDAIPEIEHEANELLAKLTDNQAQIFIESLRDLKKGGTKETLDIKISDGAGIRPYEMFSGGEAFRIDFALRVAISKLLARRAGTSLQTLIIDEGFGSQDEEGLAHIMDSIYKIQEDFAKVIIVSHLPSMKDQFPVHFFVEKGPSGSRVKVIEQG